MLSVFVVMRRWAFIGEGISHSGLGGAGVAWVLALLWPGVFDQAWARIRWRRGVALRRCWGLGFSVGRGS